MTALTCEQVAEALNFDSVGTPEETLLVIQAIDSARAFAEEKITQLRTELQADLTLWEGLLDQMDPNHEMHALLCLRVASIKAALA